MFSPTLLAGKVALITGAGTGLGRRMAERMAAVGAHVALVGRRPEPLAATAAAIAAAGGPEAVPFPADIRKVDEVAAAVDAAAARFGRLDILVNNAAGNFICPAEKLTPNGWNAVINIVLNGSFYCSRAAFPHLARSGGSILNILAAYAWLAGPGTLHSACAKAGVMAMTRTLAVEWARYQIRVNAVCPGPIHTEGTDKNLWSAVPNLEARVTRQVPMRRLGTPDEVADGALFLSSDLARWITGQILPIDGGHWLGNGVYDWHPELGEAGADG
ncbi:MAG: SDR family oxidoreductase [Planctomycetes bacterium]|nr:SDR family oxidoreductase [Planctomycetota bacterium]